MTMHVCPKKKNQWICKLSSTGLLVKCKIFIPFIMSSPNKMFFPTWLMLVWAANAVLILFWQDGMDNDTEWWWMCVGRGVCVCCTHQILVLMASCLMIRRWQTRQTAASEMRAWWRSAPSTADVCHDAHPPLGAETHIRTKFSCLGL